MVDERTTTSPLSDVQLHVLEHNGCHLHDGVNISPLAAGEIRELRQATSSYAEAQSHDKTAQLTIHNAALLKDGRQMIESNAHLREALKEHEQDSQGSQYDPQAYEQTTRAAIRLISKREDEIQELLKQVAERNVWLEVENGTSERLGSQVESLEADNARLREELEMYKRAPEVVTTGHDTIALK